MRKRRLIRMRASSDRRNRHCERPERTNESNDPNDPNDKKAECLVRHPALEDRRRRLLQQPTWRVDYFFATLAGLAAAARVTLWAIFCPLFSM